MGCFREKARARPDPQRKPNFRPKKMRPNPTEKSAPVVTPVPSGGRNLVPALGKWVLAVALAGALGAAVAAPAAKEKDKPKGPATATQVTKKDEGFQTLAPTAILIDSESFFAGLYGRSAAVSASKISAIAIARAGIDM